MEQNNAPRFIFLAILCLSSFFVRVESEITVHVVPHTHDDVGWLKTVDQYYIGSNQSIQNAAVQYILDTVISNLVQNKNRTFIYVEIAYFMRWWREQSAETQATVKQLVAEGRLEFINGGWCMNDEATTYYSTIIDQMTEGHLFLLNNFGVKPTIGWHIDPFGHSATQARLFAEMGFNAFLFARIDYQDYAVRTKNRGMEMIWRPSASLGKQVDMFTSVLYGGYGPPDGFCFECGDDPIQDDPNLFDVNVQIRAKQFADKVNQQAQSFRTNNVMLTMGSDFQYSNAHLNFKNIDKLINYMNANRQKFGMNVIYSTPSRYIKAVNDAGLTWSVKSDDFFPYADGPHAFWTGYFTSRSSLKQYVRWCENLFHSVDQIYALSRIPSSVLPSSKVLAQIGVFAEAMGVAQHHDAVSGTEKQHVAFDYAKRLAIGMENAFSVINSVAGIMFSKSGSTPTFQFCPLLNISQCPVIDNSQSAFIAVAVYNPMDVARKEVVRVPAFKSGRTLVLDSTGAQVATSITQDLTGKPVVFFTASVPALGFSTYFLSNVAGTPETEPKPVPNVDGGYILDNSFYTLYFDVNGGIERILNKQTKQVVNLKQEYLWYLPSLGDRTDGQASGAYIFRPNSTTPISFPTPHLEYVNSNPSQLVQEIRQRINPWIVQSFRLYENADQPIEIEANVGPIDISDNIGKELVSRFSTDLNTQGLWYTDSNGLEMQTRKRNYRPTWNLTVTEPVAGNYYPLNSIAFIKDDSKQTKFSVISDRSQGCGSIQDGQLEIMVNRRLLKDDSRGVGEPLNETNPIRVRHFVIVGPSSGSGSSSFRTSSQRMNKPLTLLFSTSASSVQDWTNKFQTTISPSQPLPPNVELLTLRVLSEGTLLLRLHHLFAVGEDPVYSQPAVVDLASLFPNLVFSQITPTSLSANQPLSEVHRLVWNTNSFKDESQSQEQNQPKEVRNERGISTYQVTLNPMEIKTFLVRFSFSSMTQKAVGHKVQLN